ncbi:MAG TPA: TonB-dependent receptor [Longimicrobiales bacterium]|nr:TonB-dependent receptor [Longimicrobiales bacterium]
MRRSVLLATVTIGWVAGVPGGLAGQGVATGAIRGRVATADGSSADGARVRVLHRATGHSIETEVRHGGFHVAGLEVGGPYTVTVTRLGFRTEQQDHIILSLGLPFELGFVLQPQAIAGDTLMARAAKPARSNAHGGTATTIPGSLLHRLPTPDRNVYDFVRLTPQVSTKVGFQRSGVSAAGANLRFNNFLVDGAGERFLNGNVSAAFNIGKSVPVDAVREYQVLIAPYDVRYGDFAGALINTVTVTGTNELHGSTFVSWRNDRLGGSTEGPGRAPYHRLQYGFALGGPLVRDRVHFFVAPEFQRYTAPAPGPFEGQSPTANPPLSVSASDLARLDSLMRGYGLQPGSAGPVETSSPLSNLFVRIDAAFPRWRSRATAFVTYAAAEEDNFSRADTFSLSSYRWRLANGIRTGSVRVISDITGGGSGHNELVVTHSTDWGDFLPQVRQPLVRVGLPATGGSTVLVNTGAPENAHGRYGRGSSLRIRDDLSLSLGANHIVRLGMQAERFRVERTGVSGSYGVWTFPSLTAFEEGVAGEYVLRRTVDGADATILRGGHYAAWAGDEWRIAGRASITAGLRGDLLHFTGHAPYNRAVDSIFGRRTDALPRARIHFSPRVGFTWDLSGAGRDRLRGGVGLFTGRPPLAWIVPALSSHGVGTVVVQCGPGAGSPPAFEPDYRAAPTACASGSDPPAPRLGDVDLLARNLGMAQTLRTSLAYERELPWDVLATTEVLISRHRSDFMFVNLNLAGPQAVDEFGRVLYGAINAAGVARPALRSGFPEVIDLRNTALNRSYQLSARLEKRFGQGLSGSASYTRSRVRDVQSPSRVNQRGLLMWGDALKVSGRHEDVARGISLNDLPHRAVAAFAYTTPWRRAPTEIAFYYVGESGTPFTYVAGGLDRRGDLNADGSSTNDPVYVPRDGLDPSEIRFSGSSDEPGADNSVAAQRKRVRAQQAAFETFIAGSSCLSAQRGRILERNRCREPWSHTTVASVRQVIPVAGGGLEAGLDVFNVLSLLHAEWGRYRVAIPQLLEHVGQTTGDAGTTQPIFRFDTARRQWQRLEEESAFQLQLTLRYRF